MVFLTVLWFLSGILGCSLMHAVCLAHQDDPKRDKYGPGSEFYSTGGPIMLLMAILVSVSYALDKDEED